MAEPLQDVTLLLLARELPPETVEATLESFGFSDAGWADKILQELAGDPPVREQFAAILPRLLNALKMSPDPEMALLNFARFAGTAISKSAFFSSLELDPGLIDVLVLLFGASQFFSDILIRDIRDFDWLRGAHSAGTLQDRERMISELWAEVSSLTSHDLRLAALRRFKRRELLRIGFTDIVREAPLERIVADISNVADAVLEVACRACMDQLKKQLGTPVGAGRAAARFAVIALGKLGGRELNYSSDIDILFIYSQDGKVRPAKGSRRHDLTNQEFFNRLAEEIIHALAQPTEEGFVFRVDTRLRPDGDYGPLARNLAATVEYYATTAQLWERQALLKARFAAGDQALGTKFISAIQPLVYRKYLSFEEIQEIKELKGKMERQAARRGESENGIKIGTGGIRDIEYMVQFHQLLLGNQHPELQTGNTLDALHALARTRVLHQQEAVALELAYRFLRKTEHRVMTLHQIKRHHLPSDEKELRRLALSMGFHGEGDTSAAHAFLREYRAHTQAVRRVFQRAFGHLFTRERDQHPEVDIILAPDVSMDEARRILGNFGFQRPEHAFKRLKHLAEEDSPLLRSPRTRQYLATLLPRLLHEISQTPSPDDTLEAMDQVVSSLGAKAMTYHWLASEHEALPLFLQLCSVGRFLVDLLIKQPGMLDELVDSLALIRDEGRGALYERLDELLSGAREHIAILNGFYHAELLRIGVWDIIGRLGILETFHELSDLADAILRASLRLVLESLENKYGAPLDHAGQRIPFCIFALGKYGGRELNYFSDLDLMYVYAHEGKTAQGMYASDFYTRAVQRLTRMLSQPSRYGKLYDVDARLRPQGQKGPLVCSLDYLENYYFGGEARTWERLAMTKLRLVAGHAELGSRVLKRLHQWVYASALSPVETGDILEMRQKLEESVGAQNIKRGKGGIVDIEFAIQTLRLRHGHHIIALRTPNEMEALAIIEEHSILPHDECNRIREAYTFLRRMENRLRMVTNRATDELPREQNALNRIAYSLGMGKNAGNELAPRVHETREYVRRLFSRTVQG